MLIPPLPFRFDSAMELDIMMISDAPPPQPSSILPHVLIPPDSGIVNDDTPPSPCLNSAGQWDGQSIGVCPIPAQ